jgi:hypothetical protein
MPQRVVDAAKDPQRSGSKHSPSVVDPVMSAKNRDELALLQGPVTDSGAAGRAEPPPASTAAEQRRHAPSTPTLEAYATNG